MMDMHMRADEINNIKHPTQKILLSRYVYILCLCVLFKKGVANLIMAKCKKIII